MSGVSVGKQTALPVDWTSPQRQASKWVAQGYTSDWWYSLDSAQQQKFALSLSSDECEAFLRDWLVWANSYQIPPERGEFDWDTWLLLCGRGCIAGDTLIDDVNLGPVRVDHLCRDWIRPTVFALDGEDVVHVRAGVPFMKGEAEIFRVTLESGDFIRVTDQHRFLAPAGWTHLANLRVGDEIRVPKGLSTIASIEPQGIEPFYDLIVPGPNNYSAQGFWNHNSGKTRAAVEWLLSKIEASPIPLRVAIVGQGDDDIRRVMVHGRSGVINCAPPWNKPIFKPTVGGGTLIFPNGTECHVYSAVDTEGLRGPEFHYAWFDEPMALPKVQRERALDNLEFGLRLGDHPQLVLTTTPKKDSWLRGMERSAKDPENAIHISRASTHDNARNLAENFLRKIERNYGGTRKGKQEIEGLILGDEDGALWTLDSIDDCRKSRDGRIDYEQVDPHRLAETCDKVVVSIDPNTRDQAGKVKKTAHAAGIVVVGRRGGERFVLADRTVSGGPTKWSAAAQAAALEFDAHEFVAEANQGGDMVRIVLQQAGARIPIHLNKAKQSKAGRAEPVATMYDRREVYHVGPREAFAMLEEQMLYLHEEGDPTGEDFDRVDAMVWGMKRLGLKKSRSGTAGGRRATGFFNFGDFNGSAAFQEDPF